MDNNSDNYKQNNNIQNMNYKQQLWQLNNSTQNYNVQSEYSNNSLIQQQNNSQLYNAYNNYGYYGKQNEYYDNYRLAPYPLRRYNIVAFISSLILILTIFMPDFLNSRGKNGGNISMISFCRELILLIKEAICYYDSAGLQSGKIGLSIMIFMALLPLFVALLAIIEFAAGFFKILGLQIFSFIIIIINIIIWMIAINGINNEIDSYMGNVVVDMGISFYVLFIGIVITFISFFTSVNVKK